MADYKKTQLTLPPEVTAAFESLGEDLEARNAYIGALRAAGWTLQSISEATGVTRERVRQISKDSAGATALPVPAPPLKPVKTPRTYVEPDPAKLARLLELQPEAQQNRHHSDEKQRRAAEEYTALLWEVHDQDGVTLYRLSKRLGVTHGALRFRLARYGYKLPQDGGTSKVYTRIDPANRVTI
ncbi:helix-turn-helix DNA binding domain protein [Microbacterium phage Cece]|nr:helix-turn-helix DNA binding domain protein [Microbacterium phage Cece]UVG35353.1 helix-turn-helix DNA binding domain protein [Microbacterium phage Cece]